MWYHIYINIMIPGSKGQKARSNLVSKGAKYLLTPTSYLL